MAKVKPVPEGYHSVTTYLVIKGASRALDFYKNLFGATERMRMDGPGGKVMHAEIQIGDSVLACFAGSIRLSVRYSSLLRPL